MHRSCLTHAASRGALVLRVVVSLMGLAGMGVTCDGQTDWVEQILPPAGGVGSGSSSDGQSVEQLSALGAAPADPAERLPAAGWVVIDLHNTESRTAYVVVRFLIGDVLVRQADATLTPRPTPGHTAMIGTDEADRIEVSGYVGDLVDPRAQAVRYAIEPCEYVLGRDFEDGDLVSCEVRLASGPPATQPAPLVADFAAAPTRGEAPLSVQFADRSSGSPQACQWDFGDGSPKVIGVANPSHTYAEPGVYTVTLTVTRDAGAETSTQTKTDYIDVYYYESPMPPVAMFDADPTDGPAPLTVNFDNVSGGVIDSVLWDFGDGTFDATTWSPSHLYTADGTYTVTLTVWGPDGSDSWSETVSVGAALPSLVMPLMMIGEPDAPAGTKFEGLDADWRLGESLAGGDLDMDYVADLVIGTPSRSLGAGVPGAVHVVRGKPFYAGGYPAANWLATMPDDTGSIMPASGLTADVRFGTAVAVDFYGALVAGAPAEASSPPGKVYRMTPSSLFGVAQTFDIAGPARYAYSTTGTSAHRAGTAIDVGQAPGSDYSADVLIGAPGDATSGDDGAAFLVAELTPTPVDLSTPLPAPGLAIYAATGSGMKLGSSVSLGGDAYLGGVIGTGTSVIAVGASGGAGRVFLLDNASIATPSVTVGPGPLPANVWRLDGSGVDQAVGHAVVFADVDGNGRDDLVIGAPGSAEGGDANAGAVFIVFDGVSAAGGTAGVIDLNDPAGKAEVLKIHGLGNDAQFGYSLATVYNDDTGQKDLVIGAPGFVGAGAVWVIRGGNPLIRAAAAGPPIPCIELNPEGAIPAAIFVGEPGSRAGHAVANIGDFNADGAEDLAIGAPTQSGTLGDNVGWVYVIYGQPGL